MAPPISVFSHTNPRSANQLFKEAVTQVSTALPRCQTCIATARVLADYFLRDIPEVGGLPFGVALSHATILYHLKLHRPSSTDLDNILGLLSTIISMASPAQLRDSYFFEEVIRGAILGLPPAPHRIQQRRSANLLPAVAHHVVLLPGDIFVSFSFMACNLVCNPRLDAIRREWLHALEPFTNAPSCLVSLRTSIIELRCNPRSAREHAAHVMEAVEQAPSALPAEACTLIFDHLRFAVNINEQERTAEEHALCIGASRILLELQSPCRRNYVENYLYPALRNPTPSTEEKLRRPQVSAYLGQQLLRLMCAGNPSCPFYLSCCALFQRMLCDTPVRGARFLVVLCQMVMPEGAQFVALLSSDAQMNADYMSRTVSHIIEGLTQACEYNLEQQHHQQQQHEEQDQDQQQHRQELPFDRHSVAFLLHQGGPTLIVKTFFMIRLIVSATVHSPEAALGYAMNQNNNNNNNAGRGAAAAAGVNLFARGNTVSQQAHRRELFIQQLQRDLTADTLELFNDYIDFCLPADNSTLCPDVLVTEIGMMLREMYIDDTIAQVRDFIAEQLSDKDYSRAATDDTYIVGMNRIILALSECASARYRLATQTATWLRHDPLDPATHVTLLAIMSRCSPSTRSEMFDLIYSSLITYVLPAVRNNLIAPEDQQRRAIDHARIRDCEGASSALVFVTRLLLMVRLHGGGSSNNSGGGESSSSSSSFSPLAKRLCTNLATIGASLARSVVRGQVGLVLWWSTLSLLRFGGEKSTIALSSQNISGIPNGRDINSNNNNSSTSRGSSRASSTASRRQNNNNNNNNQQQQVMIAEDREAYTHLFTTLRYVHMQFPKLVGLAVSRLIMDFCLHAPIIVENIVSALDEHYHNQQQQQQQVGEGDGDEQEKAEIAAIADARAEHFSLALRPNSMFRQWLKKQILRSVPARTSFIITYAQCVASRVRVHPQPLRLLLSASSTATLMNNNTNNNNNINAIDEEYLQLSLARERTFSDLLLKTLQADRSVGDMFCNSTCAWIRGDACPRMTSPGPFLMVIGALLSLRHSSPNRARATIQESLASQLPKVVTVAETLNLRAATNQNIRHGGVSFGFASFASALASLTRGDNNYALQRIVVADENNNNNNNDMQPQHMGYDDDDEQPLNARTGLMENNNNNNNNNNHYDDNDNNDDSYYGGGNDVGAGYDEDGDDAGGHANFTSTTNNGNSNNTTTTSMMDQTDLNLQQPFIDHMMMNANNRGNSNNPQPLRQQQQQQVHSIYSQSAAPLQDHNRSQQQQHADPRRRPRQQQQQQQDENVLNNQNNNDENQQQQQQAREDFHVDTWKVIKQQNCASLLYELRADGYGGNGAEQQQQQQQQQYGSPTFGNNVNNNNNNTDFSPFMISYNNHHHQQQQQQRAQYNNHNNTTTTTATVTPQNNNSNMMMMMMSQQQQAREFGTAHAELQQLVGLGGGAGSSNRNTHHHHNNTNPFLEDEPSLNLI